MLERVAREITVSKTRNHYRFELARITAKMSETTNGFDSQKTPKIQKEDDET